MAAARWGALADHRAEATLQNRNRNELMRNGVVALTTGRRADGEQERQRPLGGGDDEERENLSQQILVRRNARHVDLQDRLLLALARHGERGEERREEREADGEDARPDVLVGVAPRIEPETLAGDDRRPVGGARELPVERLRDGVRVVAHVGRGVGVRAVEEPCTSAPVPRAVASSPRDDDAACACPVERRLGLSSPSGTTEGERAAGISRSGATGGVCSMS